MQIQGAILAKHIRLNLPIIQNKNMLIQQPTSIRMTRLLQFFYFLFCIVKHFRYNVVNCPHWNSNPGPLPSLCLAFLERLNTLPYELGMMSIVIVSMSVQDRQAPSLNKTKNKFPPRFKSNPNRRFLSWSRR